MDRLLLSIHAYFIKKEPQVTGCTDAEGIKDLLQNKQVNGWFKTGIRSQASGVWRLVSGKIVQIF